MGALRASPGDRLLPLPRVASPGLGEVHPARHPQRLRQEHLPRVRDAGAAGLLLGTPGSSLHQLVRGHDSGLVRHDAHRNVVHATRAARRPCSPLLRSRFPKGLRSGSRGLPRRGLHLPDRRRPAGGGNTGSRRLPQALTGAAHHVVARVLLEALVRVRAGGLPPTSRGRPRPLPAGLHGGCLAGLLRLPLAGQHARHGLPLHGHGAPHVAARRAGRRQRPAAALRAPAPALDARHARALATACGV
mmetsp:Transcript_17821/g.56468  ORF Transcript_17821/g.56468 Transcript_17821/m.56468 type:complete len:246 (+) Transcript_17821:513-1250(+)